MHKSCPCTMYYCIWQMQAWDLAGATTTFLQLFLLHEICKVVFFQSKDSFKLSLSLSYENLDFILRFSALPLWVNSGCTQSDRCSIFSNWTIRLHSTLAWGLHMLHATRSYETGLLKMMQGDGLQCLKWLGTPSLSLFFDLGEAGAWTFRGVKRETNIITTRTSRSLVESMMRTWGAWSLDL
jgi:hypothetical protein